MSETHDANVRTKLNATGKIPLASSAQAPAVVENPLLRGLIQSGSKMRTKLSAMLPASRAELFMAIESERARLNINLRRLAMEAGVSQPHYERLVRMAGRGITARFLIASLRGLKSVRPGADMRQAEDLSVARAAYAGCLAAAAAAWQTDVKMVELLLKRRGEFPGDAAWRLASKVRAAALYLASTELQIGGRALAALTGLTPAAVSYALNRVETQRDEETFEAAIEKAAQQVRGGDHG